MLGWSWTQVALNISTVALAGVALLRVPCLAIGAAALLTLSTSFLMPLCNNYLQVRAGVLRCRALCAQQSLPRHDRCPAANPPLLPPSPSTAALQPERHQLRPDPPRRQHRVCWWVLARAGILWV